MKVYSLTKTLDSYVDFYTNNKNEADVIVVGGSQINLEEFPSLKHIFKCGIGVDNIPFYELERLNINLVLPSEKTQNIIYDEVAFFTIHSILKAHYFKNEGSVESWTKDKRESLSDKRLLVVGGNGNIGSRVIKIAKTMFDSVVNYDIDSKDPLNEVLPLADIVSLHLPLNRHTKSIIDPTILKSDVTLVNTSRGPLVDEGALYKFLLLNGDAVGVFDVFWKEPFAGELLKLNNFIATPHIASSTRSFTQGLYDDLQELLDTKGVTE